MAFQQQGGMGNGGQGEHHGPQGTEYTLQGSHIQHYGTEQERW